MKYSSLCRSIINKCRSKTAKCRRKTQTHAENFLHSAFLFLPCLFERPVIPAVGMAVAMRGKKAAPKFPEPGPDLLAVGLRDTHRRNLFTGEKFKASLVVDRR